MNYNNFGSANPYDAGAPVAENAYYVDGEVTVGPGFWGSFAYCMKNYCNFRGRATRTEYWGWRVVSGLIGGALQIAATAATQGSGSDVYAAEAASEAVDGNDISRPGVDYSGRDLATCFGNYLGVHSRNGRPKPFRRQTAESVGRRALSAVV